MSDQETQKPQEQVQKPSETPKITKTETARVKNPNRVAAGKKLAAYSKAAREQKKAHQQASQSQLAQRSAEQPITDVESETAPDNTSTDTITILTGIGVLVGIAGLYFTYQATHKQDQQAQVKQSVQKDLKPEPTIEPRVAYSSFNTVKPKLRSFD